VPNPQKILNPVDYRIYCTVRVVAVLFVLLGGALVLGGIAMLAEISSKGWKGIPLFEAAFACVGALGVVGGIATLRGSRRWSPMIYVMAVLYLFGFPVGTILGYVMLSGLSRYLDIVERIRRTEASGA